MTVIHDKYKLQASSVVTVAGDEKDVSLELQQSAAGLLGTISGVVYDTTILLGPRLAGATVKLFSTQGEPLLHTQTNANGQYVFSDVTPGIYRLSAVKEGYYMAEGITLTLLAILPLLQDLVLLKDPTQAAGSIYGTVRDGDTHSGLADANVLLYKDIDETPTEIASTKTIADGEYVLEDIAPGDYTLLINKNGYLPGDPIGVTVAAAANSERSAELDADPFSTYGTISGTIRNELDLPISNAFVGLYAAAEGQPETILMATYTNALGNYMFGGVPAGDYIIKSKASELI